MTKIVETSKNCKRKEEPWLKSVVNGLVSLGYDAGLCKSRWEKSPSCPAGTIHNTFLVLLLASWLESPSVLSL